MSTESIITLAVSLSFFTILTIVFMTLQILFENGKLKRKPLQEEDNTPNIFDVIHDEANATEKVDK